MKKLLNLMAIFFCTGIVFICATEVKADTTQTERNVVKRVSVTMVAGETKSIPDLNFRCSVYSDDRSIVDLDANRDMVAKRAGTTTVNLYMDNEYIEYNVTVKNMVDIVVAMGQSNMCGAGGNAYQSPTPKDGALQYEDGAMRAMVKQETLLPAFANEYVKGTGVPVVIVHVSVGGSSSEGWLKHKYVNTAAKELKKCKSYLKKNNVKIRHIYMLWYQGETDAEKGTSEDMYMANMKKIYKKMHAAGVEKCMMIRIGEYRNRLYGISSVVNAQSRLSKEKATKKKFVVVSKKTASLSKNNKWYADNVHYNQAALNKIGKDAGKNAAKIAKK